MINLPSIRQLRHFVTLADIGHFGRAAEVCLVTQSTLSASIQELEALLEAVLIERLPRRLLLTPTGEEVLRRARTILLATEELTEAAKIHRRPLTGHLNLGVIPTVAPFLLPKTLPQIRAKYPELKLILREDLTHRLVDDLSRGQLDLLLLALPCECADHQTFPLFEDEFFWVGPTTDPFYTSGDVVAAEKVKSEELLLLADGHCLRHHALAACPAGNEPTNAQISATSIATCVQMVANGLGTTLLPNMAVSAGILSGTGLASLPLSTRPSRTIGMVWRKNSARTHEFRLLAEMFKKKQRPSK